MFFREFLRDWKTVGAVAPSSPALGAKMAAVAEIRNARNVLELGPGTGALTHAVRRALPAGCSYLGIERNTAFVERLSSEFPDLSFRASSIEEYDLEQHCENQGGQFDAVVSGLPFTAFPESLQTKILDHVLPSIAPGGKFVTFAYTGFHLLPSGQRFRSLLKRRIGQLTTTPTIWSNFLPAFVYVGTISRNPVTEREDDDPVDLTGLTPSAD